MICSIAYGILGVLKVAQPFSGRRMSDDTSSAVLMCFLPAIISFLAALCTMKIFYLRLRKVDNHFIAAAILTLILFIYTAVISSYARSNAPMYNYFSSIQANQYQAIFIVSIISSVFAGSFILIWLSVIHIPSINFLCKNPPSLNEQLNFNSAEASGYSEKHLVDMQNESGNCNTDSSDTNIRRSYSVDVVNGIIFTYVSCWTTYVASGLLHISMFYTRVNGTYKTVAIYYILPSIVSAVSAVMTHRIFNFNQRKVNRFVRAVLILTLILFFYTILIATYALPGWSTFDLFEFRLVSLTYSILHFLLALFWCHNYSPSNELIIELSQVPSKFRPDSSTDDNNLSQVS